MRMKFLTLALVFVSAQAFAAGGDVELTKACEKQLKETYLKIESDYLAAKGEALAGPLKATVSSSYWPDRPDMNLGVRIEEEIDGRYVSYGAKVSKDDARACRNLSFTRRDKSACRYSRSEGPASLTEIRGLAFREGRAIKPGSRLSKIEEQQIRAFLGGEDNKNSTIKELIESTDDQELSTAKVTLPDGTELDYFGAYGGDNPFGIFFVAGSTDKAGENSDGSVCISYLK
jgi:hypothetical protein